MPALDASFLVDLERKDPAALAALKSLAGLPLLVPSHAALEVMAGHAEPLAALNALRQSYTVRMATEQTLAAAARLRFQARAHQRRPGWGDLYIAAEAQLAGTYVVTANPRDFGNLGCTTWDYRNDPTPPA